MTALVVVDVQNDFLPGGALAVPHGDEVVPVANRVAPWFDLVVATQDWHPPDHGSFAANHPGREPGEVIDLYGISQVLWPVHCVQETPGAELAAALDTSRFAAVFRKGTDPRIDSYSGFFDNGHRRATGLGDWLRDRGVEDLVVLGLATDYCVKYTALDGRGLGFRVTLLTDGCRGIELVRGDVVRAIESMVRSGVRAVSSAELDPARHPAAP